METRLVAQGKNDPPQLADLKQPVFDFSKNQAITFCVIEGGMVSGEPSVMIITEDKDCSIVVQTSLDKFLSGASWMSATAETKWGWKQPEGHATLMPPSRETRKAMLEALKKELEEWDELDGGK